MVKFWNELGFVVKAKEQPEGMGELPVFVETERGSIRSKMAIAATDKSRSPDVSIPRQLKQGVQNAIENIESLQAHLQSAITVELSTIPLYLFGMYTVKIPDEFKRDTKHIHPIISAVRSRSMRLSHPTHSDFTNLLVKMLLQRKCSILVWLVTS